MSISDRLDEIQARADAATVAVNEYLGDTIYACSRDHSAWGHGTMGLDDFTLASDDPDTAESLVDATANADVPSLLAALRAALDLHKPVEVPVISGACAAEECDHEDACPTHPLSVCGGCMERAEEVYPYATENGEAMARLVYPCDTVRAVTAALGEGA